MGEDDAIEDVVSVSARIICSVDIYCSFGGVVFKFKFIFNLYEEQSAIVKKDQEIK